MSQMGVSGEPPGDVQERMALDLWKALGGDPVVGDAQLAEHGVSEVWARLLAEVGALVEDQT